MTKLLNNRLVQLLDLLNDGESHDGDDLGQRLSISRSAVWKMIKKLQGYGVGIESIRGKGYLLKEPCGLLSSDKIKQSLNQGIDLSVFESLDSTNNYLKNLKSSQKICICLAEQQKKGRGRYHRYWHSPFGKNIYLSCRYAIQKDMSELAGVSLVIGLALTKVFNKLGVNQGLGLKWPNDVMHKGEKLAGVLVEIQAESNGQCQLIIGVGVNVNETAKNSKEISQPWTSLNRLTGSYIDRNQLVPALINSILDYLRIFESTGLKSFLQEWQNEDCLFDKTVSLQMIDKTITGVVKGIDMQGRLLIQLADGSQCAFSSGEVSISK